MEPAVQSLAASALRPLAATIGGAGPDSGAELYAIADGDQFHYEPWDSMSVAKWIDGDLVVHCQDEPLSSGIRSFQTMPGMATGLLRGHEVKLIWGKKGPQLRAKMTSNDEIKVYHPTGEYVFHRHCPEGSGPKNLEKDPELLKEIADNQAFIVELMRNLEIERQSVASLSAENTHNLEALSTLRDAAVQDRLRIASLEDELRMMEAERVQIALGQCWKRTEDTASFASKSAIWLIFSCPAIAQDGSDVMHSLQSLATEFPNVAIACDWPGSSNTRNVDSSAWNDIRLHADAFVASHFQDEASFKALRGILYSSLWFKMYSDMIKGHIRAVATARSDLNIKCVLIEGGAISRCEAHAMTFLVEEAKLELFGSGLAFAELSVVRCGSPEELKSQLQGKAQLKDEVFDPIAFATVRAEMQEIEASVQGSYSEEMLVRTAAARTEGERPTIEARDLRDNLRREMGRTADLERLVHGHLAALNADLPRDEGQGLESTAHSMTQSTVQSSAQEPAALDLPKMFWGWQRQISAVRLFVLEHHQKVLKDATPGNQRVEGRLDRAHKLLQKHQASLQQLEGEVLSLVRGPQRQQSELPPVSPANLPRTPTQHSKSSMTRTVSLPALRSPKGGGVVQAQR